MPNHCTNEVYISFKDRETTKKFLEFDYRYKKIKHHLHRSSHISMPLNTFGDIDQPDPSRQYR